MRPIELKISDLAKVAGYSRFQIDGILKQVFADSTLVGSGASAQRTFSPQDLLIVAVICELERKFSIKRSALSAISGLLQQALNGPRIANRDAILHLQLDLPAVSYLTAAVPVSEGIVLPLGPLFARVDQYLGVSRTSNESVQAILALPPTIVTRRRSPAQSGP